MSAVTRLAKRGDAGGGGGGVVVGLVGTWMLWKHGIRYTEETREDAVGG